MAGALEQSDCLLIEKHAYDWGNVGFGDVILHTSFLVGEDGEPCELYTRVVGLPGDMI